MNANDAVLQAKVDALMRAYDKQFSGCQWHTISVEEQFHVPVINPTSLRSSKTYTMAGKFDGILVGDWLLEHKTTSDDISNPHCDYWRRLAIDHQVSAYMMAAWQLGRKLRGTLYNVLRKPTIRPKRLEKAAVARIASLHEYCGQRVPEDVRLAVVNGQLEECPTLYGMRLYADACERPGHYFQQQAVARTERDMLEWQHELWDVAQEMRKSKPFRNTSACMAYGRPCEYLGICSGYDEPWSQHWQEVDQVHDELEWDGDGRSVLTYSRITCYLNCRQKHHFRYVLGIRRIKEEEEDAESLAFGTLWHEAQANWWRSRKGACNGNTDTNSNESGSAASADGGQRSNEGLGAGSPRGG